MNSYYSNIYWHFTGSPKGSNWAVNTSPADIIRDKQIKSDVDAWEIAMEIIKTKKLLATCEERISENRSTDKFCCLTDIPIQNLHEHCKYYGRVCIGFNYKAVHPQFNPVLYMSMFYLPLRDVPINKLIKRNSSTGTEEGTLETMKYSYSIQEIDEAKLDRHFINHLKITFFSPKAGKSFYREREWRSIGDFKFDIDSIACIIVPNKLLNQTHTRLKELKFENVSVLTWEFLKRI